MKGKNGWKHDQHLFSTSLTKDYKVSTNVDFRPQREKKKSNKLTLDTDCKVHLATMNTAINRNADLQEHL